MSKEIVVNFCAYKGYRNRMIDNLKGIGILLMILGHSSPPSFLYNFIYTFHMPIFFIVSGYLFNKKLITDVIQRNIRKILIPYFFTLLIITPISFYRYGVDWFFTILFTKNVLPVCGFNWEGLTGPLWFLLAFSNSLIIVSILRKTGNIVFEIMILLSLFEICTFITEKYFMVFPFQIFQSIGGALFIYVGIICRSNDVMDLINRIDKRILLIISIAVLFIVSKYGFLSMASFRYKLNLVQFLGGMSGVYILVCFIRIFKLDCFTFFGRFSLPILCLHSIDFAYGGGQKISILFVEESAHLFFAIKFLMQLLFVIILFFILMHVSLFKRIYHCG